MKRFLSLEKRLNCDKQLISKYSEFFKEYLALGHIKLLSDDSQSNKAFYLLHNCMFKIDSLTTKLRVIFDVSCKNSTNIYLNNALRVGPVIETDLVSILLRLRMHAHVVTLDIVKMYRQILVDKGQTCSQRILWRENSNTKIDTFELSMLTYGTTSECYLAKRCLQHLADTRALEFAKGSKCLFRNFYIDDLLTGADTIKELQMIKEEIMKL
ncbi:hypothetical protein KM043_014446 [Ampulex compressa]|nr:hypothetical protein KM043_014446 [Ampulex compressa]